MWVSEIRLGLATKVYPRVALVVGASIPVRVDKILGGDHGVTWVLSGLASSGLATRSGTYTLTLTALGSGITDAYGLRLSSDAGTSWTQP